MAWGRPAGRPYVATAPANSNDGQSVPTRFHFVVNNIDFQSTTAGSGTYSLR